MSVSLWLGAVLHMSLTHGELILAALLLDAWEKAERSERTGVAIGKELQLINKFFLIERATTGANTTFLVKFPKQKAIFFSALLAAQGDQNALHGAAGSQGV